MNSTHTRVNNQRIPTSMAGSEPHVEPMKITPALASRWLTQNTGSQRNVSDATVRGYAAEMRAGRWALTHQGIAFNRTGELCDGQHRLRAIVMAGVTVTMMVTTGLPIEFNSPIDVGYARRVDQILGKSPRWTAAVRALLVMEQGLKSDSKPQLGQIEECGERHKEAIDAVLGVAKSNKNVLASMVGAAAYAYPIKPNAILAFMGQVETGELLTRGDPALTLRNWASAERRSGKEAIIATLNAIRYEVQGKKLAHIVANTHTSQSGESGYLWVCQRRRKLGLPGTPAYEDVSFDARAGRVEEKRAKSREQGEGRDE